MRSGPKPGRLPLPLTLVDPGTRRWAGQGAHLPPPPTLRAAPTRVKPLPDRFLGLPEERDSLVPLAASGHHRRGAWSSGLPAGLGPVLAPALRCHLPVTRPHHSSGRGGAQRAAFAARCPDHQHGVWTPFGNEINEDDSSRLCHTFPRRCEQASHALTRAVARSPCKTLSYYQLPLTGEETEAQGHALLNGQHPFSGNFLHIEGEQLSF